MDVTQYPEIPAGRKPFKRLICQVVMFALGRGLQSLSHSDGLIQREVIGWPKDFTLMIFVSPDCGSMAVSHSGDGNLTYRGAHFDPQKADVIIYVKHIEAAFAMFTGQLGIETAYARHCMGAKGDLSNTTSVVRVINIAESYLFPTFLSRRLMKRLPPVSTAQRHFLRLKTYLLGIPFGI